MDAREGSPVRREAVALFRLAAPLMASQAGYMSMGLVDAAVVGRVGALDMGAVGLGNGLTSLVMVLVMGVGMAVEPLVAQAHGAGRPADARRWLWRAGWLVLALSGPAMLLAMAMPAILEPMGVSREIAERTRDYVYSRAPSLPFVYLTVVTRSYLANVERPRPALLATVIANVLNLILDLILVFGWFGVPPLGAMGVGWATTVCFIVMALVQIEAVRRLWRGVEVAQDERRFARKDARRLLELGWPIGLHLAAEVGIFAFVAALIGRLGEVPLAAHQVAITLASFAFMAAVGVANASTARVGKHIGAGDSPGARRAGVVSIAVGAAVMGTTGLIYFTLAAPLAALFTRDAAVIALGAALLRIAGIFAIADGVQAVAAGALRGAGETRWPFYANLGAHWLVGLPVALVLSPILGAAGFWWGLTAGLALVAMILSARFYALTARPVAPLEP